MDPTAVATPEERFRILVVCTGNVCRSPLAERIIRTRLAAALGDGADRFAVSSAGTGSRPGMPMDPRAARVARVLGVDVTGFASRTITPADVAGADLVLAASRAHRASAVRLHPPAHRYAFTILEFARLVRSVPDGWCAADCPGGADGAVLRARRLVTCAAALRGTVRPNRPEDDDLADPVGGAGHVYRSVGTALADALDGPLAVITGDTSPAGSTARQPAGTGGPGRRDRPGRGTDGRHPGGRRRRRWVVRLATWAVVAALLGAAWLALQAIRARGELVRAQAGLSALRTDLAAGNQTRARHALADLAGHTARARRLTSGPLWWLAAAPPYLGDTARAVRAATATADDVARDVLPALLKLGALLDPQTLRPRGDTVALDRLRAAAPVARSASDALAAVRARVDQVERPWFPPVASRLARLRQQLTRASAALDSVQRAARLAPAMLGADGVRHYLVAFQNNAEARGTGGLVGLYAVVSADRGRLHVDTLGSDTVLRGATEIPVDVPAQYRARWGDNPALWANSNMDPNFPYAARIWLALWERQTGQRLDGAVATDPVAMGYLLRATGPVRLSTGDLLTDEDAATLALSQVYARFPDSNDERDAFMRDVARQGLDALLSGRGDSRALLAGLTRAARERRLLVYSAYPEEERALAGTPLGGALPAGRGPYAFVVVNNTAGSKMDYYLDRSLTYTSTGCAAGQRNSQIRITFTNAAPDPARLPHYVTQRQDSRPTVPAHSATPGAVAVLVSVYGPVDSGVRHATVDGHPFGVSPSTESGRPVWTFPLEIGPGTSRTVLLDITEPASGADPVIPVQPLARPQRVHVSLAPCRPAG